MPYPTRYGMQVWTLQLRHGVRISVAALLTLGLLALGFWFAPWFTSSESPPGTPALEAADGTVKIKLMETTVCHLNPATCGDGSTTDIEGIPQTLAIATLIVGVIFGLGVLATDFARIKHGEVTWLRIGFMGVLGLGTLLMILISLKMFDPAAMSYEITSSYGYASFHEPTVRGVTEEPTLSYGAFIALAGVLLGGVTVWMGRPYRGVVTEDAVAPVAARVEPPRPALEPPPRGVETDPFRALPAPPPLAVINHARPVETPRAATNGDDAPGPSLLR